MSELFIAPTDTILGIGAKVSKKNRKAIYKLKQRPKKKKLVIMISSIKEARMFKGWSSEIETVAKKHWPGALTIVLNRKISLRIPNHKELLDLIKEIGPIYMTSANISGQEPVKSLEEAKKVFPNIKIYDFKIYNGTHSTIIDKDLTIIREGKIKKI